MKSTDLGTNVQKCGDNSLVSPGSGRVEGTCETLVFYCETCGREVWHLAQARRKNGVLPCEGHRTHGDP